MAWYAARIRGAAWRRIEDRVYLFTYERNAGRVFRRAGRALPVGEIRAVFGERLCGWRHGKHKRNDVNHAGAGESAAGRGEDRWVGWTRFARAGASVVRGPGDLQRLGGHLAE